MARRKENLSNSRFDRKGRDRRVPAFFCLFLEVRGFDHEGLFDSDLSQSLVRDFIDRGWRQWDAIDKVETEKSYPV